MSAQTEKLLQDLELLGTPDYEEYSPTYVGMQRAIAESRTADALEDLVSVFKSGDGHCVHGYAPMVCPNCWRALGEMFFASK